jgi:hypothetical protein
MENIDNNLSESEHKARLRLYDACKKIADNCEREDLEKMDLEE